MQSAAEADLRYVLSIYKATLGLRSSAWVCAQWRRKAREAVRVVRAERAR